MQSAANAARQAAFVNAGMIAGVSLLTDYQAPEISDQLQMHGTLDAVQAATRTMGPLMHGFGGKPASALFYAQSD